MRCRFDFGVTMLVAAAFVAPPAHAQSGDRGGASRASVLQAAQEAVTREFRDPVGAQFRNVVVYDIARVGQAYHVCGEVNGRNGFGAYVGFNRFAVSLSRSGGTLNVVTVHRENPDQPYMSEILDRSCAASRFQPGWRM